MYRVSFPHYFIRYERRNVTQFRICPIVEFSDFATTDFFIPGFVQLDIKPDMNEWEGLYPIISVAQYKELLDKKETQKEIDVTKTLSECELKTFLSNSKKGKFESLEIGATIHSCRDVIKKQAIRGVKDISAELMEKLIKIPDSTSISQRLRLKEVLLRVFEAYRESHNNSDILSLCNNEIRKEINELKKMV